MADSLVGDIGGFGPIADFAKDLLDKIIPDPGAAAEAKLKVDQLAQTGELAKLNAATQVVTGQLDVNKAEAATSSLFVGGWRPFIGWVCGAGLAWQFLVAPLLTWGAALLGHPTVFPTLDNSLLDDLLWGMLGLGGMRSVEKLGGVHTTALSPASIVGATKSVLQAIPSLSQQRKG